MLYPLSYGGPFGLGHRVGYCGPPPRHRTGEPTSTAVNDPRTNAAIRSVDRMIDANANRAAEAFRTLEDLARFLLDDGPGSESLKRLRHQLAAAVLTIGRDRLIAARDTGSDVGTELSTLTERRRHNHVAVAAAAASRAGEAIRVLEEAFKTIDPNVAAQIERIRYRTYTAAAGVEMAIAAVDPLHRITAAAIYALVGAGADPIGQTHRVIEAGVDVVQLRLKNVSDRYFLNAAGEFVAVCRGAGVLAIINDRADIAAASGADGVHLGQEELTVRAARRCVPTGTLLGVSTHDVDQVVAARDGGGRLHRLRAGVCQRHEAFHEPCGVRLFAPRDRIERRATGVCDWRDHDGKPEPSRRGGVWADRHFRGPAS